MIALCHAGSAKGAVLATGRLGHVAGLAFLRRAEENMVVRVMVWIRGLSGQVVRLVGYRQVGEIVGRWEKKCDWKE